MREKLFFVFLVIAILLPAAPSMGQIHSYDDSVRVISIFGEAGDTVSVPISLRNTFHVGGYLFRMTYDTIAFVPISVDTTTRSGGFEWNGYNIDEPGVIRFFATSFHPLQNAIPPGVGPISMINFYIKDTAPDSAYDIRFEDEDSTSHDNQLSDSLGTTLIIPILVNGYLFVENTSGIDPDPFVPESFELLQNYPNPFNSETRISFVLPLSGNIELAVYDLLGRRVAILFSGKAEAGRTDISWGGRSSSGDNLASGVYYYRITTEKGERLTRRMTLLK